MGQIKDGDIVKYIGDWKEMKGKLFKVLDLVKIDGEHCLRILDIQTNKTMFELYLVEEFELYNKDINL